MKALVVVYSRSGRTLEVGRRIAEELSADLEIIEERQSRKGIFGFVRSGYEALRKKTPPIAEPKRDPRDYDIVIAGSPIWAGRMASPIRTYLSRFGGIFRQGVFFCTSSSGKNAAALTEMGRVASGEPKATMEISKRQLKEGTASGVIARFVGRIQEGIAEGEPPS